MNNPWLIGASSRHSPLGLKDGVQEPTELDLTDKSIAGGYLVAINLLSGWHETQAAGDKLWREFNPEPDVSSDLVGRGIDIETAVAITHNARRDLQEIALINVVD